MERRLLTLGFEKLRRVAATPSAKTTLAKNSTEILGEYIKLLSNFTEYCNDLREEELALVIMSLQSWMIRRGYVDSRESYSIGDIFHTDLGMTYSLECSYPHPVVILEEVGNMLLVIPATTSSDKISDGFHPTLNSTGNKFIRRVEDTEDGFTHTSALLISNTRTISKGRLLNKIGQMNDINNTRSIFREIKDAVFKHFSPKEYSDFNKLKEENEILKNDKAKLEERVNYLIIEMGKLHDEKTFNKQEKSS